METDKLFLVLGDIIELISPKNSDLNNEIFLIEYIDDTKMKLRNEKMELVLSIENKQIVDKDIKMITIISRADSPSYAIQHDFTIGLLLQDLLYEEFIEKTKKMEYCGFKKFHPHDDYSIVRISYIENISVESIYIDLQKIITDGIAIFKKIIAQIK